MNSQQQQAILTIALFAAFADGGNDEREREEIRRLAESLGSEPGAPDLAGLYREVLLKRVNLEKIALALPEAEHRQLAFEMAVCVCDADGRTTEAERHFLADLSRVLGLNAAITAPLDRQAEAMAELRLKTATIVTRNESEKIEVGSGTVSVVPAWRFLLDSDGVEA